jgi:hypothetical protein
VKGRKIRTLLEEIRDKVIPAPAPATGVVRLEQFDIAQGGAHTLHMLVDVDGKRVWAQILFRDLDAGTHQVTTTMTVVRHR